MKGYDAAPRKKGDDAALRKKGDDAAPRKKRVTQSALYEEGNGETLQFEFQENHFPYNLDGGSHWIIWYSCRHQPYPNDRINEDIRGSLSALLGEDIFDFAWYIKPKMTVPELFHAQVFWTGMGAMST